MDEHNIKIICPRCGNKMNSNSRCCLKCGYLNPNVPENNGMKPFISTENDSSYQVGSGENVIKSSGQITNSIASKTGNRKVCFFINYLLYIIAILLSFLLIMNNKSIGIDTIKNSFFPYAIFLVSIVFLYTYSSQLIFIKCNKRWWSALIPFYNLLILSEMVFKNKWLGFAFLIPVIGQILLLVALYELAEKFKYNGFFAVIFPILYIPLMGFGNRLYDDINYVSEDKTLENDYKRKKLFFISILVFILLGSILIFWNNIIEIKGKAFRLKNYYYVYATRQIVNKTKQLARENYLECEGYNYNDKNGIYYIEYADIGNVAYIPLHSFVDVIGGYVIIDNTSGSSKYYVSISDGTYGYPETLYENINVDTIVSYERIIERDDINYCRNEKPKATVGGMK